MLTLLADQPECLWDDVLPIEVKELPEDLAALDALLSDHELLWPLVERWHQEFEETGWLVLTGRPADDPVGDVCPADDAQAALPMGVSDVGSGPVGDPELQRRHPRRPDPMEHSGSLSGLQEHLTIPVTPARP
jgi:hypothetical protein